MHVRTVFTDVFKGFRNEVRKCLMSCVHQAPLLLVLLLVFSSRYVTHAVRPQNACFTFALRSNQSDAARWRSEMARLRLREDESCLRGTVSLDEPQPSVLKTTSTTI
ncbi:hypothetical protein MRX96_007778 [Rhipicephalus microplus]